MKDIAGNLKTGIICFTIAIFALVPLRFVEINNSGVILGEYRELETKVEAIKCGDEYTNAFQSLLSGDFEVLDKVLELEKTDCVF